MTGYTNEEIIGRNCRFLQTPGGGTIQGAPRKYTDGNAAVCLSPSCSSLPRSPTCRARL